MKLHLIPDPHLGREFRAGVPAHRRGEREATQLVDLCENLATECDLNVCVGDLFDRPNVSMSVLLNVFLAYRAEAQRRPNTTFVVLAGNHDRSRQPSVVPGFDLFAEAMRDVRNVHVMTQPHVWNGFAFFPWVWGVSALEQLEAVNLDGVHSAIGHWDLQSFGGDDSHLCPARQLADAGVKRIISGHYHLPGTYTIDGVEVECVGSLKPYSHAEDPDETLYITRTLATYDSAECKDKCVRILLAPGEEAPPAPDCLQFSVKRVPSADAAAPEGPTLDAFDWQGTLIKALGKMTPPVRAYVEEKL